MDDPARTAEDPITQRLDDQINGYGKRRRRHQRSCKGLQVRVNSVFDRGGLSVNSHAGRVNVGKRKRFRFRALAALTLQPAR